MSAINFLRPEFFWLLLIVPLVWFVPRRVRDVPHGLLRSIVLTLVVVALARPVTVRDVGPVWEVVIVDRSASLGASTRSAVDVALGDRAKTAADDLDDVRRHLVLMGEPQDLDESTLGQFTSVRHHADSDLGSALARAGRLVPDGAEGCITLISDGLATDVGWDRAVQSLSERGLPVHVAKIDAMVGDVRPVSLMPLSVLTVGQTGRIAVDVVGGPASVDVKLTGPDGLSAEVAGMTIGSGGETRRAVVLELEPTKAGFIELEATVTVTSGSDTVTTNNVIRHEVAIQDPVKVLYIGARTRGGADRMRELLGRGFEVDARQPGADLPLDGHDVVMIDDCPAGQVPGDLQRDLVEAVQQRGLGLCMTGGPGAFGPGGYHETPIEEILPVEFVQKEEKKDPSTSLAVIIDTSGSMAGNRIRLAKEVTRLSIRRLLPHDKVGIVEFYGAKRWAAPLQSAANAIDIQRAMNRLDAGGGTILFPALEEAYYGLRNAQTRYKHVLLLTDAGVETGPYEQLLRRMARDGICVSTVLVGPERHSEFLVQISDWGNGRFYNASNRFNLPEILLKQPSSSRLPAYRPGPHSVQGKGAAGWWGGENPRDVPDLDGYVETRARTGADTVLETKTERHPVVASWRHGLGRVTAITTEPTGPGTEGWSDWDGYGSFLARILSRTASEARLPFRFSMRRDGHRVVVTATRRERSDVRPAARRLVEATSADQAAPFAFRERADGVFDGELTVVPSEAVYVEAGTVERSHGRFRLVSPANAERADEMQVDPVRAPNLDRVARATGGKSLPLAGIGKRSLPTAGGTRPLGVRDLGPWALLLALLFWLIDITWRRLPGRPQTD